LYIFLVFEEKNLSFFKYQAILSASSNQFEWKGMVMNYAELYQEVGVSSEVLGAWPWSLDDMLLQRLEEKISLGIDAIGQQNVQMKCDAIAKANDIVVHLRETLDHNADQELCARLDGIYKHMEKLLFWANAKQDAEKLEEAQKITDNLRQWWKQVNA